MTSSYALRLVCLSLAVLFLVHIVVAFAVAMVAPAMVRRAERWRASTAAQMIFALRLLPAASALFVVFAICVPTYLRLEPEAMEEDIGLACLALAVLGAGVWGWSFARTGRAVVRSLRCVRNWHKRGSRTVIGDSSVWVIEGAGRTLALAGIFRPELIVSRDVIQALPKDQLAAAVRHEQAHATARDNFKRLLMLLAPNAGMPDQLERAWARFTEWSADDRAAAGDANRPVALAAALVSVARMGSTVVPPLATALMANAEDLQVRVERLLRERETSRPVPAMLFGSFGIAAGALLAVALHPGTLAVTYRILERLVD